MGWSLRREVHGWSLRREVHGVEAEEGGAWGWSLRMGVESEEGGAWGGGG
jgi:hypothetical protein